jgi:4-aminobutyrate aminotransferase-like enzyme/Ser/Thr protein kinase RdoA (MazF antagonist)
MLDVAGQRPRFSGEDAQRIVREQFGRDVSGAQELPSDRDQNFYLEAASGNAFVLKIASAAEEDGVLDLQNRALLQLTADTFQLSATFPWVYEGISGELIETVVDGQGRSFFVRLLSYLPGVPLAEVKPQTPGLLRQAGRALGAMDVALLDFSHPAQERDLHWDMWHAARTIGRFLDLIESPDRRALVQMFLSRFTETVQLRLPELRRSVIHGDGNDHNILISPDKKSPRQVTGIIDFGDVMASCTVFELAIASAYMMLNKRDPVSAASQMIAGYHEVLPLTELELELMPTLIAIRLCTSVSLSAFQQTKEPQNSYLSISEGPAWDLLARLATIPPQLMHYTFRQACGLVPYPWHDRLSSWLTDNCRQAGPLLPIDVRTADPLIFDWSVGSLEMGSPEDFGDAQKETERLFNRLREADTSVGVGRYNEARLVYVAEAFQTEQGERRTIHIGLDLFMEAGTAIYAPLDGTVHSFRNNDAPLDYGPTIILRHEPEEGLTFYTLYGHLSRDSLPGLHAGMAVRKGQAIGRMGDIPVNGGWPPHVHFQIIGDLLGYEGDFPGVAPAGQRGTWLSLCPDPNLLLGIPAEQFPAEAPFKNEILAARETFLGPSLSVSYQKPLQIVRGWKQTLYDEDGRAYLDVVNNVCHVGHSHPYVVQALAQQAAVLNTNTRYLHPNIVRFAERLLAFLPGPLQVCFFVCSGSEANELALRLARAATGEEDMIVVDGAYHGNTAALIDISPYKHDGPGGSGAPPHVHTVPMPDPYRGAYKGNSVASGKRYAQHVREAVAGIKVQGRAVAAFICESLLSCGGQIVLPDGYLQEAFKHVRAAGGVCIVDEVQVGFGRVGSHFWGFESQGIVPDIVTMGKPMGNGHPLAAVVTTRQIADAFANGMEYFNTFGGNPVSCAVGTAVLDVIEEEGLQQNALRTGEQLMKGLTGLMERHALIGDVRGLGLFVGVELVRDRETLEPAAEEATYIVERMKEAGILLSIDGPLHNVLKLKPPMVFDEEDAARLVHALDTVLGEDAAQPV